MSDVGTEPGFELRRDTSNLRRQARHFRGEVHKRKACGINKLLDMFLYPVTMLLYILLSSLFEVIAISAYLAIDSLGLSPSAFVIIERRNHGEGIFFHPLLSSIFGQDDLTALLVTHVFPQFACSKTSRKPLIF